MKNLPQLLLVSLVLAGSALVAHAEKIVAGPKGGRLVSSAPDAAEFFVTPDRKVEITFYDAALKPAAVKQQVVAVIAEAPGGRATLELQKTAHGFVSTQVLPAGEPYRVVLQVRAEPGAKPQNFRVDLNLATCGECQRAEYACTCEGH
jgi:hypothetical protein